MVNAGFEPAKAEPLDLRSLKDSNLRSSFPDSALARPRIRPLCQDSRAKRAGYESQNRLSAVEELCQSRNIIYFSEFHALGFCGLSLPVHTKNHVTQSSIDIGISQTIRTSLSVGCMSFPCSMNMFFRRCGGRSVFFFPGNFLTQVRGRPSLYKSSWRAIPSIFSHGWLGESVRHKK